MKKVNYLFLGLAGLAMASCSQEAVEGPAANGDGNYTLTVRLPENLSSRAYGSGYASTQLQVIVYDTSGTTMSKVTEAEAEFGSESLETNVGFNLITNKTYDIVFFAYAQNMLAINPEDADAQSVYNIDDASGILTVNYEKMTSQGNSADAYDCFYTQINTATTPSGSTVTLTRPVGQVNWGTSDLGEDAVKNYFGVNGQTLEWNLTAEGVYDTLNLLSGVASQSTTNGITVTLSDFQNSALSPNTVTTIPGYTNIAVQYLLAPSATSANYDLTLDVTNADDPNATDVVNKIIVASAPVQANFRTNIYGALLTDNTNYNVKKDPIWNQPPYLQAIDAVQPEQNGQGEYEMNEQGNFIWLANEVNNGNTFEGEVFVLQDDMDFENVPMAPIGYYWTDQPLEGQPVFLGSFDGNSKTLSNVVINSDLLPNTGVQAVGLFGYLNCTDPANPTYVKDLNINNITVNSTKNGTGAFLGRLGNNVNISNITITGTVIINTGNSHNNVGGFIGVIEGTGCSVSNCSIEADVDSNSGLQASSAVAGMIGSIDGGSGPEINGLTCTNFNVYGSGTVGGIIGVIGTTTAPAINPITISNCSYNGGTITCNSLQTGGIVGNWWNATGYTMILEDCEFDGTFNVYGDNVTYYSKFIPEYNTLIGITNKNGDSALSTVYLINNGEGADDNVADQHDKNFYNQWLAEQQ